MDMRAQTQAQAATGRDKTLGLAACCGVLVLVATISMKASAPSYVLLLSGVGVADMLEVLDRLRAQDISYEAQLGTGSISVIKNDQARAVKFLVDLGQRQQDLRGSDPSYRFDSRTRDKLESLPDAMAGGMD